MRRSALPWLGLAVVVVLLLVLIGAPDEQTNRPLDPTSAGPRGAKAVVVLLEELGASVARTGDPLGADADTAVLLQDRLDDDGEEALEDWVRDGGVLVVADPSADLFASGSEEPCPGALDGVDTIGVGLDGSARVDRGASCFERIVTAESVGDGTVVSIDRPELFTNQLLDEADNAVLVAALLAPTGGEQVAFVVGSAGGGDESLGDLLGPRAAQAIAQLGVAFVVYALWRARRLGRAVVEPQPVVIAGSELVAAVGRLQEGRRRPGEVADVVRADLLRELERRLGVPAGGPLEPVAEAVAGRSDLAPDRILGALRDQPVTTDDDLLAVLADLDRIRTAVLAVPVGGT